MTTLVPTFIWRWFSSSASVVANYECSSVNKSCPGGGHVLRHCVKTNIDHNSKNYVPWPFLLRGGLDLGNYSQLEGQSITGVP